MKSNKRLPTPEICPVCGEDVPPRALACPDCGADHNSGWRDDALTYDSAGIPEADFDYDDFVRREFSSSHKPAGVSTVWWIAAIVLLIALAVIYFIR